MGGGVRVGVGDGEGAGATTPAGVGEAGAAVGADSQAKRAANAGAERMAAAMRSIAGSVAGRGAGYTSPRYGRSDRVARSRPALRGVRRVHSQRAGAIPRRARSGWRLGDGARCAPSWRLRADCIPAYAGMTAMGGGSCFRVAATLTRRCAAALSCHRERAGRFPLSRTGRGRRGSRGRARCAPSWRYRADWIPAYAGMTG